MGMKETKLSETFPQWRARRRRERIEALLFVLVAFFAMCFLLVFFAALGVGG